MTHSKRNLHCTFDDDDDADDDDVVDHIIAPAPLCITAAGSQTSIHLLGSACPSKG